MKKIVFTSKRAFYSTTIEYPDGKSELIHFKTYRFETGNEKQAEAIRNDSEFGKEFFEFGNPAKPKDNDNIVSGVRTASSQPVLGESEIQDIKKAGAEEASNLLLSKFKRFNEIKIQAVKQDGNPKKDADPEIVKEYETLKLELGL